MDNEIPIIGLPKSHDALRRVFLELEPQKILDIPVGHGSFTKFLIDNGWDVHCADIDEGNLRLENVPFKNVDLNHPLPYENESYDLIVCINGLHRLYNPAGAIAEFSRILRPRWEVIS